jgi:putative tryptophan/tyrosine transport system substrate-binding protein
MARTHQPGQAVFKSILPEDNDWKPFPAFPPSVRLAVVVGEPSQPGLCVVRVKVPGMGGKWLDLLKKMLPHTTRVAVMFNPVVSPVNELFLRTVNDAARSFDVEVTRAPVQDDTDIEAIVERLAGARNGALLVPSDAFTVFRSKMIVALATEYHLPAIYAYRRFVGDGGLVSYGVDLDEHMRSTASYVDRIIRGTKATPNNYRCDFDGRLGLMV